MYVRDKKQKNIPSGMTRYRFDARINGERFRKLFICKKSEVELKHSEWVQECWATAPLDPSKAGSTLFETYQLFLDQFSQVRKSEKQYRIEVSFFNKRLRFFTPNMRLQDWKSATTEQFIGWRFTNQSRGGKATRSTVNKDLNVLSSFFSWVIRNGYYSGLNPITGHKLTENNDRHIHLDMEQIGEILERSKELTIYPAVLLALFAGLRKGEITQLEWRDIDFNNRRINLRSETTKSKKHRSVPMPDVLYKFLLEKRKNSSSLKVVELGWDAIRYQWCQIRIELSFSDTLSVENLVFHDLRHCYAQTLRDAGVSLQDIQAFLGHASVKTTESRYAQAGGADGVNKVQVLNTLIH